MMRGVGAERDLLSQAEDLVVLAASDPAAAIRLAEDVHARAQEAGHDAARAVALRARGLGQAALYDLGAAVESLDSARLIAGNVDDATVTGQIEMTYAAVLAWAGRHREASDAIDRALAALDGALEARALVQRGTMRYRAGDLHGSLADLETARPALEGSDDVDWLARLHNNRGLVLGFMGDIAGAERDLLQALDYVRVVGQENATAETLQNLGWVTAVRGDIPAALGYFDEAEELFRRLDYPLAELLGDRCDALITAHLVDDAVGLATAAVSELRSADHPAALAEALLRLAMAGELAGKHPEAREAAREAGALLRAQGRETWAAFADFLELQAVLGLEDVDRPTASAVDRPTADGIALIAAELHGAGFERQSLHARLLAGKVAIAAGQLDQGREHLELAARARESGPADLRIQAWLAEAVLRQAEGDGRGVDRAARAGLSVVDAYQAMLGASDARAAVAGHAAELASMGLRQAASARDARRLFTWMERTRAGSLRFAPARPPDDRALASELAALRDVEARLRDAETHPDEIRELQRRRQAAQEGIRRRSLRTTGALSEIPSAPRAGDVLDQLGDRCLVEVSRIGGRLEAVVLHRGTVRRRRLGDAAATSGELDSLRFAVRRIMSGTGSDASIEAAGRLAEAAAAELDAMLVAPLRLDTGELVIVPPAELHAVPWGVLGGLRDMAVSVAPSAALWMTRGDRETDGPVVLAAGPRLAESDAEVVRLGTVYARAVSLSSRQATVEAVLSAMEGAALAHVASHGRFRADNPLFSSLELADGALTVYDIERLRRVPRTMVLSACDAGLPAARPGNEIMGLVAALLAAGTRTVLASTGLVPDTVSTLDLMTDFHSRLVAGERPAGALAAAQSRFEPLSPEGLAACSFVCFGRS